jgi:carboxyl-terminal processing protease
VPKRNVILLVVICLVSLAAYAAREQSAAGRRFGEVLALVESSYLDRVDGDALFESAVDAAIGKLDEHSAYLRGDGRRDLEASIDQRFGGVGLELSIDEAAGVPVVVSPVVDSPAWRSGVRAGDLVEAIDGEATRGLALKAVVGRLRGRVGEKVVLRLGTPTERAAATLDPGAADGTLARRDVVLVREEIRTESVLGDRRRADGSWDWMLEGVPGVALVRITAFGERTADELAAAADAIEATGGVRGVVIDLRGNPGGLLSAAVEVCDAILDEGVIVHTRSRRDAATPEAALDTRRATAGARFSGVPMAVLVDGLTASAAEIVAACLQDAGRATVVGSRTYGKGTVQSILPLADDRGLLKLTTSEYLRPSRANIHRRRGDGEDDAWGVSPDADCEVTVTAESRGRLQAWRRSRDAVAGAASAAVRPLPAGLPAEIDSVLARALGVFGDPAARVREPDFGGEKEAPRDDDEPARPDA